MERKRGPLEDNLIDEVVQWCLWNYATGTTSLHRCEGILTCAHSERVRATEATVGLSVLIHSRSSQALLDSLSGVRQTCLVTTKAGTNMLQAYDGIRRRTLPILYDALKPGTEDDRMKGALWTLNNGIFGNVPPFFLP